MKNVTLCCCFLVLGIAGLKGQCSTILGLSPAANQGCGGDNLTLFINQDATMDFVGLYYSLNGNYDSIQLYNFGQHAQLGILPINADLNVTNAGTTVSYLWGMPNTLNGTFYLYAILGTSSQFMGNPSCRTYARSNAPVLVRPGLRTIQLLGDSTRICQGNTAIITAQTNQPTAEAITLNLTNGGGQIQIPAGGSTGQRIVQPLQTTSFSIASVGYQSNPTCLVSGGDTATILVRPDLAGTALSGDATICQGASQTIQIGTLSASADIEVSLSDGNVLTIPAGSTGSPFPYSVSPSSTTVYSITQVNYLDNPQCTVTPVTGPVTLKVREDLSGTTLLGDSICTNETGTLSLKLPGISSPLVALISGGIQRNIPPNATDFPVDVTPAATTTYTLLSLRYTDGPFCEVNNVSSNTVTVNPLPIAAFEPRDATVCYSNPTCVINSSTGTQLSYLWRFGPGLQSQEENPCVIVWEPVAQQTIRLRVENEFGCRDSAMRQVAVDNDGPVPAEVLRVRKQDDPNGVLLIAQDTANQKDQIEYYEWFLASGQSLSGQIKVDFFYHTNVTDSVYVVTKLTGSACLSRSFLSRQSGPLSPFETSPTLTVFPNPSAGSFQIRLTGGTAGQGQLRLLNLWGQTVWASPVEKGESPYEQKVHPLLPAGHYMLEYWQENQPRLHQRLIIQ